VFFILFFFYFIFKLHFWLSLVQGLILRD